MIIPEIEFALKDGRKAVLRSPRDEDIPGMLETDLRSRLRGHRSDEDPREDRIEAL